MKKITDIAPACLGAVLIHRPDAHPAWSDYVVSIVHLRPIAGLPADYLAYPDSTHEILVLALDPDHVADPADRKTIRPLNPANLVHQLRSFSDRAACAVFADFCELLNNGSLSPDTDHIQAMRERLELLVQRWGAAS